MHVRAAALPLVVLAGLTAWAAPASAHVTVHSPDATQGNTDALLQIRVPNEKDNATANQIEVDFPISAPMVNLYVQPTPGWNFAVTDTNLSQPIKTDDGTFTQVVTKIVWSGGKIPVGGYQDFNLDVSLLPKVAKVELKALETYSDGDIVRWIEDPAPPGQPDPEHPAPILELAPASSGDSGATTTTVTPTALPHASTSSASDSTARTLSIVALIIGIVGIGVGALGFSAARRARPEP